MSSCGSMPGVAFGAPAVCRVDVVLAVANSSTPSSAARSRGPQIGRFTARGAQKGALHHRGAT